jgi:hypothetical protein
MKTRLSSQQRARIIQALAEPMPDLDFLTAVIKRLKALGFEVTPKASVLDSERHCGSVKGSRRQTGDHLS